MYSITIVALLVLGAVSAQPNPPYHLKVEYLDSPVWGMDVAAPRFSYAVSNPVRGAVQTFYQILINTGGNLFWDSTRTASNTTTQIEYTGATSFASDTTYSWTVRWWDETQVVSEFSEPAIFHTGLYSESDWSGAQWIGGNSQLRKEFQLTDEVTQATISIIGLGYYVLGMNGQKVGDAALGQFTTFQKRVLYDTYDVTNQVKRNNAIYVTLGNGWYTQSSVNVGPQSLYLVLHATLASGDKVNITSDLTWKTSKGPVTFEDIYDGEDYDARLETPGWEYFGYDDSAWTAAVAVTAPTGVLSAQMNPLIKKVDTYSVVNITEPQPGVWVFDFGQNMAGWARFTGSGVAGSNITMFYSEIINPDGTCRNIYGIRESAIYIFRGDDQETYEPTFAYFGFQYVQLTGYVGTPTFETMQAYFIHTAVPETGEIIFESPLLNQIQHATRFASLSNFMNVPTDCPQRERRGWLGDAQLSTETTIHNFDMGASYTKFVRDIYDSQNFDSNDGQVPDCVPFYGHGGIPADPAWGTAYTLIWNWVYEYYGDVRILSTYYDGVKRYIDSLTSMTTGNILGFSRYGDWCSAVDGISTGCGQASGLYSTFYYLLQVETFANVASVLGNTADAQNYSALAAEIRAAWDPTFYHNDTNTYDFGYQSSQSMAIWLNTTDASNTQAVFNELLNDIQNHTGHLTAGIVGIKYTLLALSEMGRTDVAYVMATQNTFPSWGYMIEQGATTLWENWQSSQYVTYGSRNHIMYGSQSAWYFQWLAGIRQVEGTVGFEQIIFAPRADQISENHVSASILTQKGLVSSSWNKVVANTCQEAPENTVLTYTCGDGVITTVDFASFGTPNGECGDFTIDSSCNSPNSVDVVTKACVGKSSCSISATNAVFGGDPCVNTPKRLYVQLSGCIFPYYSHSVSVPVTSTAAVYVPKFGLSDVVVSESNVIIWKNGAYIPGQTGVTGAEDVGYAISVSVGSGSYVFNMFGNSSKSVCGWAKEDGEMALECPADHVISEVKFAQYGDRPSGQCGSYSAKGCSAGSAKHVVETACFGKNKCTVSAKASAFMTRPVCADAARYLHAEVTCSRW